MHRLVRGFVGALILFQGLAIAAIAQDFTDVGVSPLDAPYASPVAGSSFIDPTFGWSVQWGSEWDVNYSPGTVDQLIFSPVDGVYSVTISWASFAVAWKVLGLGSAEEGGVPDAQFVDARTFLAFDTSSRGDFARTSDGEFFRHIDPNRSWVLNQYRECFAYSEYRMINNRDAVLWIRIGPGDINDDSLCRNNPFSAQAAAINSVIWSITTQ